MRSDVGDCDGVQTRNWLDEIRGRVDWYLAREMPPTLYPWDGPELYPLCPNFDPSEFSGIRARAVEHITRLLRPE